MALPFLFVPINAVAYVGLPQRQDRAGLEPAQRRAQPRRHDRHLDARRRCWRARCSGISRELVEKLNPLDPNYNDWLAKATGAFGGHRRSDDAPLGGAVQQVQRQAAMLAFLDVFRVADDRRAGR